MIAWQPARSNGSRLLCGKHGRLRLGQGERGLLHWINNSWRITSDVWLGTLNRVRHGCRACRTSTPRPTSVASGSPTTGGSRGACFCVARPPLNTGEHRASLLLIQCSKPRSPCRCSHVEIVRLGPRDRFLSRSSDLP